MSISCFSSAMQIVRALREGEVSVVEVLDLFLAQYELHHGTVNAVCTLSTDARETAMEMDKAVARGESIGQLHGLPVSFKDSYETKGMRTTCGFPPLRDFIPDRDATVVKRIREAGGIPFAKTNVPMLLSGFHTENEIFGRTNNPWNPAFTAGGSSGGSAAALAAGMTSLDMASDMLGSIRVPAHFCGVAGLKPTQFRISPVGHYPPLPGWPFAGNLLAVRGPMARRVEDLLLALPLIDGFDFSDPESIPMRPEVTHPREIYEYRIAWTDDFGGVPVTEETRRALEQTANSLERAGVRVEKTSPPNLDFEQVWLAAGEICSGILSFAMTEKERHAWADDLSSDGGPLEVGSLRGLQGDVQSWRKALEVRLELILKLRTFFEKWDGWLVPTTCAPAFRHEDHQRPVTFEGHTLSAVTAMASYVTPFNLSGSPAVTFPVALSGPGLPIGLQLVGSPWQDMALLHLANKIENIIPPFARPLISLDQRIA